MIKINRWELDQLSESEYNDLLNTISNFDLSKSDENMNLIEKAYLKRYASLWALKYKAIKNKPTVFASSHNVYAMRKWQIQILDDPHDNIVIQKSRQLGLSETGMTKVLHFLANHDNTKAVYTFPRDQQMKEFSNTRIAPALQTVQYMQSLTSK